MTSTPSIDAMVHAGAAAVRSAVGTKKFILHLAAEDTDFVRFNHGKVRQPGSVRQLEATLTVADGQRHATQHLSLSGDDALDQQRLRDVGAHLAADLAVLDEDPYFCFPDADTEVAPAGNPAAIDLDASAPPDALDIVTDVCDRAGDLDFVGILANGTVARAVATSEGKLRAFSRPMFHLDWSVYAGQGAASDKAIKQSLAGPEFDAKAFSEALDETRAVLPILRRDPKVLPPGDYRAYLAPAAVDEIMSLLAYGTFSQRALQSKTSALLSLQLGEAAFSSQVTVVDDAAKGTAPRFSVGGFDRPSEVPLIVEGKFAGALTSPRSALEYGVPHTGADASEIPSSLSMRAGTLAKADILKSLGTGVYVGNLWYCNFSDPRVCRVTGMTRFGTFWVEDGEVVAPLGAMRFDSSLYRLLGEDLENLDAASSLSIDSDTYGRRSTSSKRIPGALVSALSLTL